MPSDHSMPRLPDTSVTSPPIPPIDARSIHFTVVRTASLSNVILRSHVMLIHQRLAHPVVTFFLSAVFTSMLFILHRFSAEFCIHTYSSSIHHPRQWTSTSVSRDTVYMCLILKPSFVRFKSSKITFSNYSHNQ